MSRYEKAKEYILERLKNELSPKLFYHNIPHILDVLNAAENIANSEKVSIADLELLRVAVLFHDSGFIVGSINHENTSCEIAKGYLPGVGYSNEEVIVICELIMATRVPHAPKNLLEEIICDADLDYLGRDDFYTIGDNVFQELLARNVVNNKHEWNQLQVKFLSSHTYFTETSKRLRKAKKDKHIEEVKQLLKEKIN